MKRRSFFKTIAAAQIPLSALPALAARPAPPSDPPGPITIVLQRSPVRGFHYRQPIERLQELYIGRILELRTEPENLHDPQAVAIYYREHHIGYLPRENNAHASRLLNQGLQLDATITRITPDQYKWEPLEIEVIFYVRSLNESRAI